MTQAGFRQPDPFQQVFVSIDLETTGLNPHADTIIEVGAVKFRGDEVLDRYQTFVNPGRKIPQFIQQLTSINPSHLERAPSFAQIAGQVAEFIGDLPIIGHNVKFDIDFLTSHRLELSNKTYNTWDLASIFLPEAPEYNLSALAQYLGLTHAQAHRASADAEVTAAVFHRLLEIGSGYPAAKVAFIARAARTANATVADLLEGLIPHAASANSAIGQSAQAGPVGLNGLNLESLSHRLSDGAAEQLGVAIRRELTEQQVKSCWRPTAYSPGVSRLRGPPSAGRDAESRYPRHLSGTQANRGGRHRHWQKHRLPPAGGAVRGVPWATGRRVDQYHQPARTTDGKGHSSRHRHSGRLPASCIPVL